MPFNFAEPDEVYFSQVGLPAQQTEERNADSRGTGRGALQGLGGSVIKDVGTLKRGCS
jgi:hypothetical protein